jgi:hypothetical protein
VQYSVDTKFRVNVNPPGTAVLNLVLVPVLEYRVVLCTLECTLPYSCYF